mmetsp:Transcript_330/g.186  ORF Transcript_330/g.186 Transcript_330/m.186 type:complete len:277 (-) Transcript_330:1073-1903(-)
MKDATMMKKTVQTSVPLAAKCNTWVMGCATLNATLKHVSTMGTTAWNVTSSALKIIVKFAFLTKLQMGAAKKSVTQRLVLTTEATVLSFVPWGVLSPTLATPIVTWSASTQLVIGMGRTAMIWAVPLTVITLISTMASVKSFVTTLGVTTMETTAMKESVPRGVRPAWWMTALAMQSATRQLATGTATTVSSSPLVRRNVWKSSLVTEFVTRSAMWRAVTLMDSTVRTRRRNAVLAARWAWSTTGHARQHAKWRPVLMTASTVRSLIIVTGSVMSA